MSETLESECHSVKFVHSISGSSRFVPPATRWNSIELDFTNNILPRNSYGYDSLPSRYSKSIDFNLTIGNKRYFKRCVYGSILIVVSIPVLVLLLHFSTHHKQNDHGPSKDLTLALKQALLFFDAQKSGYLPKNYSINFRGNSGLNDGKEGNINADLVGGFYDSGNNIKFSFSTAYMVTVLSWTVIEYHQKYADIGELNHINDIIKWGSDYLLKLFIPPNSISGSAILYSQVGGKNDVKCWQKPEDMNYPRPISVCDETSADLAGEIVAAMSSASLVFTRDEKYSKKLIEAAEKLFSLATMQKNPTHKPGIYTDACGGQARDFYNSTSYIDELVWGATWLHFATGNSSYLKYATDHFGVAEEEEMVSDKGVFYLNNKLTANAILMTRIRYFMDLGYPYEDVLSTNRTDLLMCSFLSNHKSSVTGGGLVVLKPDGGAPLQYAATAAFLSKLYSDYLHLLSITTSGSCTTSAIITTEMLQNFAMSQVNYILGDNPMKMSYIVGYGDHYPNHVHHRGASTPLDGKHHTCVEGNAYLHSKDKNPNELLGAMVRGPDKHDVFLDDRAKPWFTEPSISSNAGLVAALIALHDGSQLGIDKMGIFKNFQTSP